MTLKTINIKAIRIDGGTQSRVEIHNETVADYADAIKSAAKFPPMVVFHDGADYWLADGFHRWHAFNKAGKASTEIDLRIGTRRDAVLFSFGVNGTHGMRRMNADKRKAVKSMLEDSEWAAWSDNKIADTCGVSHPFVAEIRRSILKPLQDRPEIRTVERAGKAYQQDTSKIGNSAKQIAPKPAKPKLASVPTVDPALAEKLDEAQEAVSVLSEENDRLNDRLAVQSMDASDEEKRAASETIAELRAKVKALESELSAVKSSRDGYMRENAQLKKQVAMQRKQLYKVAA